MPNAQTPAPEIVQSPGTSLDDHAYARIRAMITSGALQPGDRIVPEQLARDMGISRTPLLGALKRLFQERIVEWRSRRGVFVRRPTKLELAQIFEVREVLEGLVARRAALVIEPNAVDSLRRLFDQIQPDDTPQMRRLYLQRDYQFHTRLLEIAENPALTSASESLNIMVSAFAGGLIRSIREGLEEHEALFTALRNRDADEAEVAMRLHIRRSVDRLYQEAAAEQEPAAWDFAAPLQQSEASKPVGSHSEQRRRKRRRASE